MSIDKQVPTFTKVQEPMTLTMITTLIVVVLLLCVGGLAYSLGWFNWSGSRVELENNEVGVNQTIDPEATKEQAVEVTQKTAEPAATATE